MTFISQTAPTQQISWGQPFVQLATEIRRMFSEAADRRRMKESLRSLSAKDLRDVGLTRNDVSSIDQLPLSWSSAQELSQTAMRRAGNW